MAAKPALVLIPGVICDERLWQPVLPGLEAVADVQVTRAHFMYDSVGAIAEAILAEAPQRFSVAGLSFGGYLAQEIVRCAPERVERLALLNTAARADDESRRKQRQGLIRQVQSGRRFIGMSAALAAEFVAPDRRGDEGLIETIRMMAQTVGPEGYIRQQTAILNRADGRPALAKVACPTLIVAGRSDRQTPVAVHEEMHALIPGSRLVVLEKCGHLSPLEQPEAVLEAMRSWMGEP